MSELFLVIVARQRKGAWMRVEVSCLTSARVFAEDVSPSGYADRIIRSGKNRWIGLLSMSSLLMCDEGGATEELGR